MTNYVINPPAVASVAVAGSEARFPVRRIFCVGRNYAAHAREMGRDPDREPPFSLPSPLMRWLMISKSLLIHPKPIISITKLN